MDIYCYGTNPGVFEVARDARGLWLFGPWTRPGSRWYPGNGFVFGLRKSDTKKLKSLDSDTLNLRNFEMVESDFEYLKTFLSQTKVGKLLLTKIYGVTKIQ